MTAHTPGEWILAFDGSIHSKSGKFICGFRWDSYKEFTEGNNAEVAHLIAAAPDLLKALEAVIDLVGGQMDMDMGYFEEVRDARAAIAKAKGQTP